MRVTFLGSGTSQGVPVICCPCEVCHSADPKDKRLRSSILVETDDTTFVIDSGPDFRYQMLRQDVKKLDAIVFTHGHKDHTAGMDDVRAFNYFQQKEMDVFASLETQEVLRREFQYIFEHANYPGVPQIRLHELKNEPFYVNSVLVTPIRLLHYKMEVFGFRIGDFTYITDANYIAPEERDKARGSHTLVLNALRLEKHISHFTLEEAIEVAQDIHCQQTYFTHISHQLGIHTLMNETLPEGIALAYDGLVLEF
ncbi:MAG TPA: MBL fold metallo-hydrolase [Chitinophagaceae bacterium]|nr:MBL fold metallo-hydrolase [Chitinophagaceae bacterium]